MSRGRYALGRAATFSAMVLIATACGRDTEPSRSPSADGPCQVDTATDPGSAHVAEPTFQVDPPAGGDHLPSAARAGFFEPDSGIPPDGAVVHALEHGYVAIWYQPTLDQAGLATLRQVFKTYSKDVLVLPRPSIGRPVAATAWHQRLLCSALNAGALTDFVKTYRNQGPEKIPHP